MRRHSSGDDAKFKAFVEVSHWLGNFEPHRENKGLVLHGKVGRGKTHLMVALLEVSFFNTESRSALSNSVVCCLWLKRRLQHWPFRYGSTRRTAPMCPSLGSMNSAKADSLIGNCRSSTRSSVAATTVCEPRWVPPTSSRRLHEPSFRMRPKTTLRRKRSRPGGRPRLFPVEANDRV